MSQTTDPFARFTAFSDEDVTDAAQDTAEAPQEPAEGAPQEPKKDPITMEEAQAGLELFILQKLVNDAIGDFTKDRRTSVEKLLERASDKFDVDNFSVKPELIDGTKELIAKVTVKRTKAETKVADTDALMAWVEKNRPDLIVEEEIPEVPAIPARKVKRLKAGTVEILAKDAGRTDEGTLIVKDTGEEIAGLTHDKGGDYAGIQITHGAKGVLKERGLELLFENKLKGNNIASIIRQAQIEKGEK